MKKIFITLFTVFYLSISFGGNLSMHFCMGELVEWDLNQAAESSDQACDNCGMPPGDTDGCCNTETTQVTLDVGHKTNCSTNAPSTPDFAFSHLFFNELIETAKSLVINSPEVELPLLLIHELPKFLLNRNIRI